MVWYGMMTWQQQTDEYLVQRIGKGRMQALAELVRRHQQQALQLAFRSLHDWHLAEDVVQEAFLRVNRAAPKYKPEAQFSTWFYRIVVNLCMDELRRLQRRAKASVESLAENASSVDMPEHGQARVELKQAVQGALDQLNERERLAVILHRFEGLSHEQIAEIMAASVSAVESLLVRAYRKLRKALAPFSDNSTNKSQVPRQSGV
jgi:RNA polymerase sigma-70 factor (ECF subfamily)